MRLRDAARPTRRSGMSGVLFTSYEEVRLAKAQFDAQVQQTAVAYATAYGSPISYNKVTGEETDTISTLVPIFAADEASDTVEQLDNDWIAFYKSWASFYGSGTDQASTLWFPNFPDDAEYSTLMQYEAALASLQARIVALYPKASIVMLTPPATATAGWLSLYPSLSPAANTTATSLTYVGLALAIFYYLGPALSALSGAAAAEASAWSPSPRRKVAAR